MKVKVRTSGIVILVLIVVAILCVCSILDVNRKESAVQGATVNREVDYEDNSVKQNEHNQVVNTDGWNLEKVNIVYDTENVPVPLPKGYTASSATGENTIDTGFVIYEGTDSVDDSNVTTAKTSRNQWVWVPIYDINEIYGIDSTGRKFGKLYYYDANGRYKCNWTDSSGIGNYSNYREPDVVTSGNGSYDIDSLLPKYIKEGEQEEFYEELASMFDKTIASIEKSKNVKTGDNIFKYIIMMIASGIVFIITTFKKRDK